MSPFFSALTRLRKKHPLALIVLLALTVRLYNISSEPLDWHAFRQADTASVTREYVKNGIDLLVPRYDDLGNIQSGKENPEGYRMVEFPIINALTATIIQFFRTPIAPTSRVVAVLFSIGSLCSLYYLTNKLSGKKTALLTSLIFALLPFSIYYSRAILPESPMLFFMLSSFASYFAWLTSRKYGYLFLATILLSLAFLMKPFVVFMVPALFAMVWFVRGKNAWREWSLPAMGILAVLPFLWWRRWIEQFPSGIPANDWLFNGNQIRFRPAWFRWLFWERFTKLICGYIGIVFFPFNFLNRKKDIVVYASWWFGAITYLSVVATGNVQHDYYQAILIPIICITIARGALEVFHFLSSRFNTAIAYPIVTGLLLLSGFISWRVFVHDYFNINHWDYIDAGKAVDRLTPPDAKVIAPAFGDTMFLYQTNRRGWPIGFEIEKKIQMGATHYITTAYDDEAHLIEKNFTLLEKGPNYLLFDLTKPLTSSESAVSK